MHLFWFCAHSLSCFNAYFILSSHLDASLLVWSHLVSSSSLNAFLLFSLFCLTFFFWLIWTGPMLLFFSHLTSVILVCLILMFPSHLALSWATICTLVSSCLCSSHQVSFILNAFLSCFDTFLLSSSFFVSFLLLLALSHFDASCLIPFLILF